MSNKATLYLQMFINVNKMIDLSLNEAHKQQEMLLLHSTFTKCDNALITNTKRLGFRLNMISGIEATK